MSPAPAEGAGARLAGPEDADAVAALLEAAFGDEGPAVTGALADLRVGGLLHQELVVSGHDGPIGYAALSHAWLDARRHLVDVLLLSPLAVAPGHQGRGAGRALLEAAVGAAEARGAPAVFLEGDPAYYGPRGWEPGGDHGFRAPSDRTPAPAFQVRLLPAHEPWMTGRLVYPDTWWRHDLVGLRDPLLATVERELGVP